MNEVPVVMPRAVDDAWFEAAEERGPGALFRSQKTDPETSPEHPEALGGHRPFQFSTKVGSYETRMQTI